MESFIYLLHLFYFFNLSKFNIYLSGIWIQGLSDLLFPGGILDSLSRESNGGQGYYAKLEECGWLRHIRLILKAGEISDFELWIISVILFCFWLFLIVVVNFALFSFSLQSIILLITSYLILQLFVHIIIFQQKNIVIKKKSNKKQRNSTNASHIFHGFFFHGNDLMISYTYFSNFTSVF